MEPEGYECEGCGGAFGPAEATYGCPRCGGNLDVRCRLEGAQRSAVAASRDASMWRWAPLLPVAVPGEEDGPLRSVGGTPLLRADRLAAQLGLRRLWIKDEGRMPTGSLKDRASAVVVQRARAIGAGAIVTASTGNAGVALAAMAQAAGLRAIVLVPHTAPRAKLAQLMVFGATLVPVRGTYDDAFRLSTEAARALGLYCRNTGMNPFTVEGKKTVAFEIAEQLGFRAPDRVVVPVGDGNILTGVHRGFRTLVRLGWIDREPKLLGVQAEGSSPIARAFEAGADRVAPVHASTRADSICAGAPSDGVRALAAARATGGALVAVPDAQILAAIPVLGREAAVFAEPAAAAGLAGLQAALSRGLVSRDDEVVLLVTGTGLKDVDAAAEAAGDAPAPIEPVLDALRARLRGAGPS